MQTVDAISNLPLAALAKNLLLPGPLWKERVSTLRVPPECQTRQTKVEPRMPAARRLLCYQKTNAKHLVEERLCCWLLRTRDLIGEDTLPLTQEYIAQMLGVRRTSVTLAARNRLPNVQSRGAATARVLIVEDDYLVALELEHHLREAGLAVVGTAATAEEALDIAARKSPKLPSWIFV